MTELKSRRLQRKITQKEAAERIGISLRSYIMYENDESKEGTPKYRFLLQEMDRIILLDESHGILSIEEIKQKCADVFALMTEWRQFRMPSWNVIKKVMTGNVVVDGRNIYDRAELEEMGVIYTRIGEM